MFNRILLAVDGSEASQKAVDWAIKTYQQLPNAHITILYVHQPQVPVVATAGAYIPLTYDQVNWEVPEETPALEAWDKFPDKQRVTQESVVGYPAEVICKKAKEENFDVIVLGAEGHGVVSSVLLGSVSAKVLHHATVSVLIIR